MNEGFGVRWAPVNAPRTNCGLPPVTRWCVLCALRAVAVNEITSPKKGPRSTRQDEDAVVRKGKSVYYYRLSAGKDQRDADGIDGVWACSVAGGIGVPVEDLGRRTKPGQSVLRPRGRNDQYI